MNSWVRSSMRLVPARSRSSTHGDHAAEAVHLPPGDGVLRVAGQARGRSPWRRRMRPPAIRRCAGRSRNGAACEGPGSSGRGAARKLSKGEAMAPTAFCRKVSFSATSALSPDHQHAAHHVGVAVQVLGGGVHHEVEAVLQRALAVGRGEGVVRRDQARPCAWPAPRAHPGRRGAAWGWWVSPPRSAGWRAVMAASTAATSDRFTKLKVSPCGAAAHLVEQAEAAAVEVVGGHHVGAGVQHLQRRGDGGEARGEGEALASRSPGPRRSARRRSGWGCASGNTRSPCERPGSPGRRWRWRRSASSPRRSWGPATARRGWRGWRSGAGWRVLRRGGHQAFSFR